MMLMLFNGSICLGQHVHRKLLCCYIIARRFYVCCDVINFAETINPKGMIKTFFCSLCECLIFFLIFNLPPKFEALESFIV